MIEFMIGYSPLGGLRVDDVKSITFFARQAAFEAFTQALDPSR